MRIEAVTICQGYDDFLAVTARYNKSLFDNWIVVTTEDDTATREVCRRHSIRTLVTNDAKDEFCKGRIIDRALQHVASDGWRIHLDADIVLPAQFRHLLASAELQQDTIYGIDRIMVKSYESWEKFKYSGYFEEQYHSYHCHAPFPKGFELGARWSSKDFGWVPIGFFQMWHSSQDQYNGVRNRSYPHNHNDACRTDVQFALQWDRSKRILIPEIIGVHLESEAAPLGANWKGRTTKRFCK